MSRQLHEQFNRIQKLEDKCETLTKESEALKDELSDLKKRLEAGDAGAGIDKTGTDTTE